MTTHTPPVIGVSGPLVSPSQAKAANRRHLAGIAAFCRDHGFNAFVYGDSVTVWIPWSNVNDGTTGEDEFEVTTMAAAREVLGY